MKDLKGKVAVVTGAAQGIGRAFAGKAHELGMRVVLSDVNAEGLAKAVAELPGSIGFACDVSSSERVEELAAFTYEGFGAAHVVINNAGLALGKSAWETTLAEWDRMIGVNVYGVIHGIRSFVPRMLAGGDEGRIVNVASAAGLLSFASMAAYNVTKFSVVTLSEGLQLDFSMRKTRLGVTLVCPAWVKTGIMEHVEPCADAMTERIRSKVVAAVEGGIPAETVASEVFAAVQEGRFWVITHPMTKAGVKVRFDDFVEGRPPTPLSM